MKMQIFGITAVVNHGGPPPPIFSKYGFVQKSCIWLRKDNGQFYIYLLPDTNIFQLNNNNVWLANINEEFTLARISFRRPKVDLLVSCEAAQLKPFFRAVDVVSRQRCPLYDEPSTSTGRTYTYSRAKQVRQLPFELMEEYSSNVTDITLNLSKDFGGVPEKILTFAHLAILHLTSYRIVHIPEDMGSMPCLKVLKLPCNRLGFATRESWKWLASPIIRANLEELDLRSNRLTYVPEPIMHLTKLRRLILTENSIQFLPMSLVYLKNLEYLEMSFNRLQSLPGGIMALPRLREVYMRNNNFTRGVREYGKLRPVRVAATFGVKTLLDKAAEVVMLEPSRCYYWMENIPAHLANFMKYKVKYCRCGKPFFTEEPVKIVELIMARIIAPTVVCDADNEVILIHYICSNMCLELAPL